MQEAVDESGEVLFKPEEYLDANQIKLMFYSFAHREKRKLSRPSKTIKAENSEVEKPHNLNRNQITENAKNFIKNIFNETTFLGRGHRKKVAAEIVVQMREAKDDMGNLLFR